ncbi:MAG: cation transporter [Nitrososphaera sp.]|nr:cation transporter [Nitrososphaera sp.]
MAGQTALDAKLRKKTLYLSLVAIASVFVFEIAAGLITNSLALLTDSTHALLDAVVTGILIIAVSLAARPRDTDHTYGHGKIEIVGGFIGGVALFFVSVFFIYEATARIAGLGETTAVIPGTIGFAAVIYTLAVDVFRITILRRASKKIGADNSPTLKADLYHAFADFASTAVALVGLWLVTTGVHLGDSVAAILLGGFLAYLSSRFAYRNAVDLTDRISPRHVASVRQAAAGTEGVLDCRDVKMRKVGMETFVEVTISMKADISFEKAHEISAQVEQNIASVLSSKDDLEILKNITVHFEPTYSADIPPESIIERAAARVAGVKGIHNIIVSKVQSTGRLEVSLHVQVNRSATLSEAHLIANAVEDSIKSQIKEVGNITVHLEPLMPNVRGIAPISDVQLQDSIIGIVRQTGYIQRVGRIATFRTEDNTLKIDVDCVFSSGQPETIERVHEIVSDIEKQIRLKYPGSIVTIHTEPG